MNYKYCPTHPIQLSSSQLVNLPRARDSGREMVLTAAQVGADMQLNMVLAWLYAAGMDNTAKLLYDAMRPAPPLSKREQALKILSHAIGKPEALHLMGNDISIIREALKEGQE